MRFVILAERRKSMRVILLLTALGAAGAVQAQTVLRFNT
jgi:hypothetical protein